MKKDFGRDVIFTVFIMAVLALAVVYFTVPERAFFLEHQIEWWNGIWRVFLESIHSAFT